MRGDELTAAAPAKVNLALVVGPLRPDGKHEVATVLLPIRLADTVTIRVADAIGVDGFPGDTIVSAALERLRERTGVTLAATIEKRIPVAAGLGGGSSDAATALRLGNELAGEPLAADALHELAAGLGADVPFFLAGGSQLGTGDGSILEPVDLPDRLALVLALPHGVEKASTAAVYGDFDERHGEVGFEERRAMLVRRLAKVVRPEQLASLPPNDLASSPLAAVLESLGALRADVSGAGPTVYGVFADVDRARAAADAMRAAARTWVTAPLDAPRDPSPRRTGAGPGR